MAHMRVVSLPKSKQQLATKIQRMKDRSEVDLSQADLEALLPDNNPKDIKDLSDTRYLTFYIEDLEEDLFEIDPLAEEVDVNIDNHKVWQAVAALPSPHREVISRLFGMEDGKEVSITTICKALKISKEQVRKIRAEGLSMLQEKLGSGAEFF
jgi:DNA-directed RNA polymerase sigma subunit (sigma70/sigma32)